MHIIQKQLIPPLTIEGRDFNRADTERLSQTVASDKVLSVNTLQIMELVNVRSHMVSTVRVKLPVYTLRSVHTH